MKTLSREMYNITDWSNKIVYLFDPRLKVFFEK